MASSSCRVPTRRIGGSHGSLDRKSDTTTASPRRTDGHASRAIPSPRAVPPPPSRRGAVMTWCSSARTWARPPRAGIVVTPSAVTMWAPTRLPDPSVRYATLPAATMARSRLVQRAVPKSRLGERSTSSQVSSSRSAIDSRTWGSCMRAVTFQSMRRTSSPAT